MPAIKKVVTSPQTTVTKADLMFQIDQLRKDKMIFALEAIKVSFAAVLTAVFLPELLFRLLYSNTALKLDPEMLSLIPGISYGVAMVWSIFVGVTNVMRWSKIKALEQQLATAKK